MRMHHDEQNDVLFFVDGFIFHIGHVGTFFAPTDDAFESFGAMLTARGVDFNGNDVATKGLKNLKINVLYL